MANSLSGMVFVMAIGLLFLGVAGFLAYDQQQAIESSVEVEGTVVESDVRVDRDTDSGDTYYPEVEYRYTYEGETYTNGNVFPGTGSKSTGRDRAEEIAEEYSEGDRVTVYVRQDEPERAYLIEQRSILFLLLFGGAGAITTLAGAYGMVKRVLSP